MINLRNKINNFYKDNNFIEIKEKNVNDVSNGNDFNSSLLAAHLDKILDTTYDKIFINQRTFYAKGWHPIQRNPLFSFFHVMSNYYIKNPESIKEWLNFSINMMKDVLGIDINNLYMLVNKNTFDDNINHLENFVEKDNLWITEKINSYEFEYNDAIVRGEYIKFLYKYNDNIFPIYDFVLMEYKGIKYIEAGFLVERMYFIGSSKKNVFDTDMYSPIIKKAKQIWDESIFSFEKDFLGYTLCSMIRSITLVMLDSIVPSNKTSATRRIRTFIKIILMKLQHYNYNPVSILYLLDDIFESIKNSGYIYKSTTYDRVKMNFENEIKLNTNDLLNFKLQEIKNEKISSKTYNEVIETSGFSNHKKLIANNTYTVHGFSFEEDRIKFDNNDIKSIVQVI